MSTAAILTYPDFFKVAVSCSGNHDNSIYNRWWSEKHHGYGDMNEYFFWRLADYYCEWLMGCSERGEVDIKEMNND